MKMSDTRQRVIDIIERVVPGVGTALDSNAAYIPNLVSSLEMLDVFTLLETELGIRISPADVRLGDLDSLDSFVALVERSTRCSK